MNETIEHIICQYLSGEITDEEEKILFEWINLSKENELLFFELTAVWDLKSELKKQNSHKPDHSLNRLNTRIDKFENKRNRFSIGRIIAWSSIAAIFIGVFLFIKPSVKSFSRPVITYSNPIEDSIMTITLDDKTTVWLNSNSTLQIMPGFSENERKVQLSGCAFFDVSKDSLRPFIVSSEKFQIRVLGTSFGINSDYSEYKSETILLEGSVQIENAEGEMLTALHPGQQALIAKDLENIEIVNLNVRKHALWRFGIISLQNVTIPEILNQLEEIYQVKIQIDELAPFENNRYNFSFLKNNNPEDALRYLYLLTGKKAKLII